jgi:amino acid permease
MVLVADNRNHTGISKEGIMTATTVLVGERSPLLLRQGTSTASDNDDDDDDDYADDSDVDDDKDNAAAAADAAADKGGASFQQTVVSLMKACMGTGCLALPFAAQQGGIVLFCLGMVAIAAWNVYAVQRLVQCLHYVPNSENAVAAEAVAVEAVEASEKEDEDEEVPHSSWQEDRAKDQQILHIQNHHNVRPPPPPPPGTSTLGTVAYYAFGPIGLQVLDTMMIILLLGVITAYFAAVISFLADTPLTMGPFLDAAFTAVVMATISLVPNIGFLSRFSAIGLGVLFLAFLVIAGHGISEHWGDVSYDDIDIDIDAATSSSSSSLALWPESIAGVSSWFGCVIFSFGVPPLTYNFHSSMKEPDRLIPATVRGFSFVAVAYMIAGVALYALYPNLTGEVLHELPHTGVLPTLTRLGMVTVVWMTAPLLIVPCGQLLEGKWQMEDQRVAVRFGICAVTVLVAVALPSFVQVLSFVGCACVGMVSFCVPPVLHLKLALSSGGANNNNNKVDRTSPAVLLDAVMLVWGVTATVISSYYSI